MKIFFLGETAPWGQGLLFIDGSWSPSAIHTTLGKNHLDER